MIEWARILSEAIAQDDGVSWYNLVFRVRPLPTYAPPSLPEPSNTSRTWRH